MPFSTADAKARNKAIKSDAEAAMFVTVANKQLAALLKRGVEKAEAEKRAIAAGSKAVGEMHRKGGPKRESLEPGGDGCNLLEFVDSRGVPITVDREKGLISGVKILGLSLRHGDEQIDGHKVGRPNPKLRLHNGRWASVFARPWR